MWCNHGTFLKTIEKHLINGRWCTPYDRQHPAMSQCIAMYVTSKIFSTWRNPYDRQHVKLLQLESPPVFDWQLNARVYPTLYARSGRRFTCSACPLSSSGSHFLFPISQLSLSNFQPVFPTIHWHFSGSNCHVTDCSFLNFPSAFSLSIELHFLKIARYENGKWWKEMDAVLE